LVREDGLSQATARPRQPENRGTEEEERCAVRGVVGKIARVESSAHNAAIRLYGHAAHYGAQNDLADYPRPQELGRALEIPSKKP
jgi:hypothetical protein